MLKILLFLLVGVYSIVYPRTYYIDAAAGSDSTSGLSENEAWKTIEKVNSSAFDPGDIIAFKRGELWREQLNLFSSGTADNYITVTSYGTGDLPIISGSDVFTDFIQYSDSIWTVSVPQTPRQLFVDNIRGIRKSQVDALTEENNWYYSTSQKKVYLRKPADPSSFFIEIATRPNTILVSGEYIHIEHLQVQQSALNAIEISPSSKNILVNNVNFLQWSSVNEGNTAGIFVYGTSVEIYNCTFGRNTGDDIADQNWAGVDGIRVKNGNGVIHDNQFYHNSLENENSNGLYSHGIYVESFTGNVRIYNNYIYHTGSHGIRISGYSVETDSVFIYDNTIEYPGQAGVCAFRTRSEDGKGGTGFIFRNYVSFANRLGGDIGSGGAQSCGIHVNDGVITSTEPEKPFIKWYIYDNIVHSSQSNADPGSEDSGGIIADFNAHNTEIYRNLVFNNWGKGISVWNANNTKIYYNIVFGNDAGIIITAANKSKETANNHLVFNNTCFKNFNGSDKGSNLNTEIFFGKNGHNSIIKNNIFYAADEGFACIFDTTNSTGIILDNNLFYRDQGDIFFFDNAKKRQTFEQWKTNHPEWDQNSLNIFPDILIAGQEVGIKESSPAIDKAVNLGQVWDFKKNPIVGLPDIGAVEFHEPNSVESNNRPNNYILHQNYPNPFNPATEIKYQIPSGGGTAMVTLKIYDLLGNEINTLVNEEKSPGIYSVRFEASGLASGVYYYRIKAGSFSSVKKMILLR